MDNIDFIGTYMPDYSELTQEEVYDVRDRLEQFIQVKFNDVDLNPNTVVGDLIITPQAYTIAAIEKGLERFTSDLDLANVAAGNIFNCDFVKLWLHNFNVSPGDSLQASGILRLVFNTEKDYVLDRSTRFQIGNYVFSIYLPDNGPFYIARTGRSVEAGQNGTVLRDTGSNAWFADVPVVSFIVPEADITNEESSEAPDAIEVSAGTDGLISVEIPELVSISALDDFVPGSIAWSLPQLAELTRTTMYSASMTTRTGTERYIRQMCPFVESISPVHNGDKELLRDYHNEYGIASGCMDIYVRSKGYAFTETQVVKLSLLSDGSAFEGDFPYVGQPYYIESVTHTSVDQDNIPCDIISTNEQSLGALASYTQFEKLKLSVPNTKNSSGDSIYTISTEEAGSQYTYFTVTYQTDPMFPALAKTIENDDHRPINTSLLVRGFIPVIIRKFNVAYVRKEGLLPDLETAAADIKSYLSSLAYPSVYTDAEIARIMQENGAKYTANISVDANVQWSVATKIMDYTGTIEDVPKEPRILSSAGLRIVYPADSALPDADTMYACSVKNVKYYLMDDALAFTELKDI